MNNFKNTEEKELAFHEKINPLMELIMKYSEKEGIDLYAQFKCGTFQGIYRLGDSLLSETELYTQLQVYESRYGKSLIQNNNNVKINVNAKLSSKVDPEEFANKIKNTFERFEKLNQTGGDNMKTEFFQTKVSVSNVGNPEDYVNLPILRGDKPIGVVTEVTPRDGYYTLNVVLWQNIGLEMENDKPIGITFK